MKSVKTHALQPLYLSPTELILMETIPTQTPLHKVHRQSYEKPHEAVNRALKAAQNNASDVTLVIYDVEYVIKKDDTYETLIPLKKRLNMAAMKLRIKEIEQSLGK